MNKKFKDVKPGDIVYKVAVYDSKTRIIKKIVKSVESKSRHGLLTIHCECKDSEYYANFFVNVQEKSSIHKNMFAANSYLCTNIKDAKSVCLQITEDIISNAKKELNALQDRLDRWHNHLADLSLDKFLIK